MSAPLFLRAAPRPGKAAPPMTLEGTAVIYDVPQDLGEFTEIVRPGAFKNLRDSDILFLDSHLHSRVLGRTGAGTLSLTDSDRGLDYRAALPDSEGGREAWELSRRGDYAGVSVGFRVLPGGERWEYPNGGRGLRELTALALDHLSPVARPAYADTRLVARMEQTRGKEIRTWTT